VAKTRHQKPNFSGWRIERPQKEAGFMMMSLSTKEKTEFKNSPSTFSG